MESVESYKEYARIIDLNMFMINDFYISKFCEQIGIEDKEYIFNIIRNKDYSSTETYYIITVEFNKIKVEEHEKLEKFIKNEFAYYFKNTKSSTGIHTYIVDRKEFDKLNIVKSILNIDKFNL